MEELWTEEKYEKFVKEVRHDMVGDFGEDFACDIPQEIAKSLLQFEKGLKSFIINELGAVDFVGRLADDIAG